ncbi:MAG: signal peptide peptidase SppA, partial [Candidatus Binatia bacterium]
MLKPLRWVMRLASIVLLAAVAWYFLHGPAISDGSYLVMEVSGAYSEGRPGGLVQRLFGQGRSIGHITETLRKVRYDGRIAGVIVRIGDVSIGWAQAHEIRHALALVKARGKRVIAELEVELEPAAVETWIASVADAFYVMPGAAPLLTGLQARAIFLGGVWPKLDVTMQVEKIREYKTAGDELSRETMSPAHREMLDSLLDDIHRQFVATVATARNLGAEDLEAAIAGGMSRPAQLVAAGIANAVRSHEEIVAELGPVSTVTEQVYAGVRPGSLGIGDGPAIAVVHASGAVNSGRTRPGGANIGSRSIAIALEQAATDPAVNAIVLRVSSPGGSPAASDEIWLAVREAAKKKPVIASLGDVAASGGYYAASAADRIVASPGTLTGSIGVVFFKPDVSGLLARAGVHTETLQRGRYARLLDLDKSLDGDELEMVRTQLDDIYRLFLERVATGRKKKPEDIDRVGGGRVWTGQQALERGLVDEIGTLDDAVRAAANAAGIHDADKVHL